MKLEFKVEENGVLVDVKVDGMSLENSTKLLDSIRDVARKQLTKNEKDTLLSYKEGYQHPSLTSDKKGLHHVKSEYENDHDNKKVHEVKDYGVREIDGEKRYQMFYICTSCNHKGKRFIPHGSVYTNCHECGQRMNISPATENGLGYKDDYSNYYIAGAFQRSPKAKHAISS